MTLDLRVPQVSKVMMEPREPQELVHRVLMALRVFREPLVTLVVPHLDMTSFLTLMKQILDQEI